MGVSEQHVVLYKNKESVIVQLMHLDVDFVYVQLTLIYVPKEGRELELGHDNPLEVIEQQLTVIA